MAVKENPYEDHMSKGFGDSNNKSRYADSEVKSVKSFLALNQTSKSTDNLNFRDILGKRSLEEYPNHFQNYKNGKYDKKKLDYD